MFSPARHERWADFVGKVRSLGISEWLTLVRCAVLFGVVEGALRLFPYRVVAGWTDRRSAAAGARGRRAADPERLAALVRGVSRLLPWRPTCLRRVIVARLLLASHGFQSQMVIGAAKNDGRFEAHAWLEYQGRVILGAHPRTFTALAVSGSEQPAVRSHSLPDT